MVEAILIELSELILERESEDAVVAQVLPQPQEGLSSLGEGADRIRINLKPEVEFKDYQGCLRKASNSSK